MYVTGTDTVSQLVTGLPPDVRVFLTYSHISPHRAFPEVLDCPRDAPMVTWLHSVVQGD